ncbi:hypothetical protein [Streptomyces sp. NPDC013489]|uniref:hypothetical protein n=1 Tax=Streptomyces sp. NPDC013489 TaxID=3155606 RepID=UPI0033EE56D8
MPYDPVPAGPAPAGADPAVDVAAAAASVVHALHDDHVAGLLDQALYHVEHLRLGMTDAGAATR